MLSTSARLLRLASLLQSRRHWPGADLAQALGVDARTMRRDVDRLRELGYPVEASSGVGGGSAVFSLRPQAARPVSVTAAAPDNKSRRDSDSRQSCLELLIQFPWRPILHISDQPTEGWA